MRKIVTLIALLALAGCGGGGGGSAPVSAGGSGSTGGGSGTGGGGGTPQGDLVTPQFTITIPARTTSSTSRTPQRVSSATLSVVITRTSQSSVKPTSATTNLSPTCGTGCTVTVNGPPSPPGVQNDFQVDTFDATGGGGHKLDTGTKSFTPVVGTANQVSITLKGIPDTVSIAALPTTYNAGAATNTTPATTTLSVTVKDAAGVTIAAGTYENTITITDPDSDANGTTLTAAAGATSCTANVCTLTGPADTITFTYKGVAMDPVTITSAGTGLSSAGTVVFTPVLKSILYGTGPTSLYTGSSPVVAPVSEGCGTTAACGIDLYTSDSTSGTAGYSDSEKYTEDGFTNNPFNKALSMSGASSCSAWADNSTGSNSTTTGTPFTFTTKSSPTVDHGVCLITVSDGLAASGHTSSTGPQFVVTYTTSSLSGSARRRKN